jgi:hypothetical protein
MAESHGFLKYVKKAFFFPWHLLALLTGAAFGILSGHADVVLPLLGAGEAIYLSGLCTRPKFQAAVDAEEHKTEQTAAIKKTTEQTQQMIDALNTKDRQRFENLRSLCRRLHTLSHDLKGETAEETPIISDLQSSGINRLLWIYLKLLFSKNAIEQFFGTIDEREIEREVEETAKRLKNMGPSDKDGPIAAKKRKSLEDHVATSEMRLTNYQRAKENYDLILVDLDRLYSKIASLSELGINRQDPNFITSEVDSVSESVQQTEKAMGELQILSGLSSSSDETPPALLEFREKPSEESEQDR